MHPVITNVVKRKRGQKAPGLRRKNTTNVTCVVTINQTGDSQADVTQNEWTFTNNDTGIAQERDTVPTRRRMAQHQPRYKSEVFVPIQKDNKSFEERQHGLWAERNIWQDMEERMQRRRQEWENEVDHMRHEFFRLKPTDNRRESSENLLESRDLNDIFIDDVGEGSKKFRVSFEVSQFKPEEISVRTQDNKLVVNAKHEEKGQGKSLSREFSRQVDIPRHIDPEKLSCTLSNDGVLQIEAPVPAPAYNKIQKSVKSGFPISNIGPTIATKTTSAKSGPSVTEEDGSKKFRITVDIGREFLPQDVMVKTIDRKLVVNAKHEEKGPGRSSMKEFSREFDLPELVDPNLVTASLTDDGKLVVEAPISNFVQGSYTGRPGSSKQPKITISFEK